MTNEELVLLYQQGDKQALESLIKNNKGRVFKIANKFYTVKTNSIDIEDLEQEGYIGLVIAAKKYDFDMDNNASFITYATYWIYSKIHRFVKQKNTNDETSLNTPIKEDEEAERQDLLESTDYGFENLEEQLYLKQLRAELEEIMKDNTTLKERLALKLYYGWDSKPMTVTEVGEILNVKHNTVSCLNKSALKSMREDVRIKQLAIDLGLERLSSGRYTYSRVDEKIDFINKYFNDININLM